MFLHSARRGQTFVYMCRLKSGINERDVGSIKTTTSLAQVSLHLPPILSLSRVRAEDKTSEKIPILTENLPWSRHPCLSRLQYLRSVDTFVVRRCP